ncbi:hypothetical protein GYMLUDRAFT_235419 [Collybiopsis luxurians FD-317 M1]|nr:hypothetical protein GYMLUDRAFT_235419 [Collybiopsis luxurians FD-317 M1]
MSARHPNNSKKERRRKEDALRQEQQSLQNRPLDLDEDGIIDLATSDHGLVGSVIVNNGPVRNLGPASSIRIPSPRQNNAPRYSTDVIVLSDDDDVPVPPKKKRKIVIDISDDDDIQILDQEDVRVQQQEITSQRNEVMPVQNEDRIRRRREMESEQRAEAVRQNKEQEEEREEEYQTSLDVNDPDLWEQLPPSSSYSVEELSAHLYHSLRIEPLRREHLSKGEHSSSGAIKSLYLQSTGKDPLEHIARMFSKVKSRSSRRFENYQRRQLYDPSVRLNILRRCTPTLAKQAAGAINKIVQYKSFTVVGSSVDGGYIDEPDEIEYPYNKPGTLVVWDGLKPVLMTSHSRKDPFLKHYTVNDVATCPRSDGGSILISSGNDYKVHLWEGINYSHKVCTLSDPTRSVPPMDIAVNPKAHMFAFASHQTVVCREVWSEDGPGWESFDLELVAHNDGNRTASLKWGHDSTKDTLFASSEQYRDGAGPSSHKAFDTKYQKTMFKFDLEEEGDALALDSSGERLAICSVRKDNDAMVVNDNSDSTENILRLYDVRRKNGSQPIHQITLERSGVNSATFSPDGIFLAVARADGRALVYDSRFLGEGELCDFEHNGPSAVSPQHSSYGITHAEWRNLPNNQLGLLTGGPDGCVRLWQPGLARSVAKQGKVIAQVHGDVGYFSVGDRFEGEHELVVGDGDGAVYFFDGIGDL